MSSNTIQNLKLYAMPKRRRYSKKRRATNKRRRRRYKKRRKTLPLAFPKTWTCRLRYVDFLTLDSPGTLVPDIHVYRANSLTDPDFTGSGHQPKGFDEIMKLYRHYTVIGSKITVTPVRYNTATNSTTASLWGVNLTSDEGEMASRFATGGLESILESRLPGANTYKTVGTIYNLNKASQKQKCHFSAKKFFRKKSGVVGESELRGYQSALPATGNPVEQAFFNVWAQYPADVDPDAATFIVQLEYIAVFTEPQILEQS